MSPAGGRLLRRQQWQVSDYPLAVAWSPDGQQLLVGGGDGGLWLLDTQASAPARELGRHAGGVLSLDWQRAGRRVVSSGQDGTVRLWELRGGESVAEPRVIHAGAQWCEHLAFSDNGRLLAVASGKSLLLFNELGELQHTLPGRMGAVAALAWRPKSAEVAAAGNGGVQLHRVEPQLQSREYSWRGACLTADWSPDGRVLAAGMQDGSLHIWYVAAGTELQMQGYGSKVTSTQWSANGRMLATSAAETIIVWSFAGRGPEGSRPLELRAHSERVELLRFRGSGTWLVSAGRDRRLLLWRVGQDESPQDAHLLADECAFLSFSRDGAQLAVGDVTGTIAVFDCKP